MFKFSVQHNIQIESPHSTDRFGRSYSTLVYTAVTLQCSHPTSHPLPLILPLPLPFRLPIPLPLPLPLPLSHMMYTIGTFEKF